MKPYRTAVTVIPSAHTEPDSCFVNANTDSLQGKRAQLDDGELGESPPPGVPLRFDANTLTRSAVFSPSSSATVSPASPTSSPFTPVLSVRADPSPPSNDENLMIPVSLTDSDTFALIDTGSQRNLIDEGYARSLHLPLVERSTPMPIEGFDGHSDHSLTFFTAPLKLQIGSHVELIELNVSRVAHYPLILGTPWIRTHDVSLLLADNEIAFSSPFCLENCLPPPPHSNAATASIVSAISPAVAASTPRPTCPNLAEHSVISPPSNRHISVSVLFSAAIELAMKDGGQAFLVRSVDIVKNLRTAAAHTRDPSSVPPPQQNTEELTLLRSQTPAKYHAYLDCFSKQYADSLPGHREYDLASELEDGKDIPTSRIYPLSAKELELLADYIETTLRSGFIRPSTSSVGSPILFSKKRTEAYASALTLGTSTR